MYHLSDTCLPPDYGTPAGSRFTASDSSTHRLRNAGGTYGALFRVRLCGVYTQSGKRRGEYALAVLLPPLSRPSSSPSPPSALASGTGRVWSSQLIRRGAGRAAGHVVCPGTTKSIVRRMAATARLDPLTWLRLRSRLPKEFRTVRIDFR